MKLDYIYHSGFAIEADGVTVIIDYYKDSSEEVFNKGIVHDYLLEKPGVLYVLCSHFHPDHFNREVLSWKKLRPDIRYIFSKDILNVCIGNTQERKKCVFMIMWMFMSHFVTLCIVNG